MAIGVCLLLLLNIAVSALSGDVPVLMWSPERPLSDLPQAPAGDSIGRDSFHSDYLKPLLSKESRVLVAFLQDKLHINDISKYANVYNQDSDGGAFKNIKNLLDDNFSLELPRVMGSHLAVDDLKKTFDGSVHELTSASDLSNLNLGKGNTLVIVRLQPVRDSPNEEATIAANDDLVGKVCKHMQKRSVKYTALYTAESSSLKAPEGSRVFRRLLDTGTQVANGTFFNISYVGTPGNNVSGNVYFYFTSLEGCAIQYFDHKSPPKFCPDNFTVKGESLEKGSNVTVIVGENATVIVQLDIKNITVNTSANLFDVTFKMPFKFEKDRWLVLGPMLTFSNGSYVEHDYQMVSRGYDDVMNVLYSYHCTEYEWFPKNQSVRGFYATIKLGGFQIQVFNTTRYGFSLSQDCVPWFTTAIWMALFIIGIHLLILFFGMYMVASLSTNDRFDDPKGKALVVNAGEG